MALGMSARISAHNILSAAASAITPENEQPMEPVRARFAAMMDDGDSTPARIAAALFAAGHMQTSSSDLVTERSVSLTATVSSAVQSTDSTVVRSTDTTSVAVAGNGGGMACEISEVGTGDLGESPDAHRADGGDCDVVSNTEPPVSSMRIGDCAARHGVATFATPGIGDAGIATATSDAASQLVIVSANNQGEGPGLINRTSVPIARGDEGAEPLGSTTAVVTDGAGVEARCANIVLSVVVCVRALR